MITKLAISLAYTMINKINHKNRFNFLRNQYK